MSFESLHSIFVHFPKTGGSAVHFTADAHGRRLKYPPDPCDGHKPASWFDSDKPSWVILRDPVEWYVSIYRFCVDAGWSVQPDCDGMSFVEFVEQNPSYYDHYCTLLEVEKVDHVYRYGEVQEAYNRHVGPERLIDQNVSKSLRPAVNDQLVGKIVAGNKLGMRLYTDLLNPRAIIKESK